MSTPKENAYDQHISPLMQQIIEICRENNINMFATFSLDFNEEESSPLRCSTCLPVDKEDEDGIKLLGRLHQVVMPRPEVLALTILTKGEA